MSAPGPEPPCPARGRTAGSWDERTERWFSWAGSSRDHGKSLIVSTRKVFAIGKPRFNSTLFQLQCFSSDVHARPDNGNIEPGIRDPEASRRRDRSQDGGTRRRTHEPAECKG